MPAPLPPADERHARFTAWQQEHGAILHRTARSFARGHADQADLMQELLLALWHALPAFRGEAQPVTFIYRVTHNAALSWLRRRRSHSRKLDALAAEPDPSAHLGPAASPPPARDAQAADDAGRLAQLYAAIHALAPPDRSLVLLSLDGLPHRAIAAIHGLSEGNVSVRLHRLRQQLTLVLHPPVSP